MLWLIMRVLYLFVREEWSFLKWIVRGGIWYLIWHRWGREDCRSCIPFRQPWVVCNSSRTGCSKRRTCEWLYCPIYASSFLLPFIANFSSVYLNLIPFFIYGNISFASHRRIHPKLTHTRIRKYIDRRDPIKNAFPNQAIQPTKLSAYLPHSIAI